LKERGISIIKNIIFDIGNVLLEWEPLKYIKTLYDTDKANSLVDLVYGSKRWLDVDKGLLDFSSLYKLFTEEQPDLADDFKCLMSRETMINILKPKQDTIDFMFELKSAGYKIYLLSNFASEGFSWIEERYKFLGEVDGRIISSHVKLIKPDHEIYRLIIKQYSLDPSESLFIDDMEANVQAARHIGIHAIRFIDVHTLKNQLNKLLMPA
jgi:putative hydrolase of the HAD superfamily